MRAVLVAVLLLLLPATGWAEWQVKPFAGVTFGNQTTLLIDFDRAAEGPKFAFGVSGLLLGDIFGVEGDLGVTPGYFTGGNVVVDSSVVTATGNLVIALPRHVARYGLRPYVAGGLGLMRVRVNNILLPVRASLPAMDAGAGVTGFFTNRIGISWDVRYFRSIGSTDALAGLSLGPQRLSFWRATTAVTIRP